MCFITVLYGTLCYCHVPRLSCIKPLPFIFSFSLFSFKTFAHFSFEITAGLNSRLCHLDWSFDSWDQVNGWP